MGKRGKLPKNKLPVGEPVPCQPTKADEARERRYRAEDALRTLQRAREVERDKQLMGDVKTLAREQMQALGSVAGKSKDKD